MRPGPGFGVQGVRPGLEDHFHDQLGVVKKHAGGRRYRDFRPVVMEAVVCVDRVVFGEVLAEGAPGRAGSEADGVPVPGMDGFCHVLAFAVSRNAGRGAASQSRGWSCPGGTDRKTPCVLELAGRVPGQNGVAIFELANAAVRDYVARRRPEIRIEEGRGPARVFIPQHHPPGLEAEVDFGELWVRLAGTLVKCYLFAFRMSYSGKAVHLVSATCGQEAFLEGHVHAFTVLGGVPAGQIRYGNLTPATRVLRKGRARIENPRWTAFRSHYRFAAFYCEPGIEGAHEKGGVEGQAGYFRRNYLVPSRRWTRWRS